MSEIMLVLLFALLLYGGRLPEVARSLGRSIASIKRGFQESAGSVTNPIRDAMEGADSGLDGDLDEGDRPRTVRRIRPAPDDVAKEDISAPASSEAPTPAAADPPRAD